MQKKPRKRTTKKSPARKKRVSSQKPFKVNLAKRKTEHRTARHPDNITQWMAFLVILVANLLISITLIPILIVLRKTPLYLVILIIGAVFGTLFELILEGLPDLETHHHIIARFFIPGLAIINIAIITGLANKMDELLLLPITHTPTIIALLYTIAFLSPVIYKYILDKV